MHSIVNGDSLQIDVLHKIETKSKINFIDENSQTIFDQKEHALIGISPSNSYYSLENIDKIASWILEQNFKDFHFFLADQMSIFNFLALGYPENKAKQENKKKDNQLFNKIEKVFQKYNISKNHLLTFSSLLQNTFYQKNYEQYKKEAIEDVTFNEITHQLFEQLFFTQNKSINSKYLFEYLYCEIPLLLNTPQILQKKSSICIYHQENIIFTYLYKSAKKQVNSQGFGLLTFK